jgi:hypothetical protein
VSARTSGGSNGMPCDFNLTELRTLRAQERIPQIRPRNTIYDGRYTGGVGAGWARSAACGPA